MLADCCTPVLRDLRPSFKAKLLVLCVRTEVSVCWGGLAFKASLNLVSLPCTMVWALLAWLFWKGEGLAVGDCRGAPDFCCEIVDSKFWCELELGVRLPLGFEELAWVLKPELLEERCPARRGCGLLG